LGFSKAKAVAVWIIAKSDIRLLTVESRIIAAFRAKVMFLERCEDSSIKSKLEERAASPADYKPNVAR
jgi:hypothetical protein